MASLGKTDSASDSALGYSTLESGVGNVILTSADALLGWSRGQSLWAFPMGTACCAMELIAASFSKFDFDRLGVFPRQGPRHTDVMIVAGTITEKMKPVVIRLYEQMAEPKWVIAMGNCAISGGIFYYDTYSVVRGVDQFLPVDVYIAGCPPRPESLQDGIVQLRNLVRAESVSPGVRYRRRTEIPLRTAPAPTTPAPAEPASAAPASAPSKDPA
ncbi:MAG: NADH-quinone oxidoreductase subunit B [Coriobacteriia bacterium]|nr:NADH-quinone oxidoreductase subunit B [Coriobacteriia bacterium]